MHEEHISQSAGGLVIREHNGVKELLLVETWDKTWVFPKGHVDPGETVEVAALREVKEETGIIAAIHVDLGDIVRGTRHADGKIKDERIIKIFLMTVEGDDSSVSPEEIFGWFTFENALPLLRYDEDRAFLQRQQSHFV